MLQVLPVLFLADRESGLILFLDFGLLTQDLQLFSLIKRFHRLIFNHFGYYQV